MIVEMWYCGRYSDVIRFRCRSKKEAREKMDYNAKMRGWKWEDWSERLTPEWDDYEEEEDEVD